jgi:hypothetical protein
MPSIHMFPSTRLLAKSVTLIAGLTIGVAIARDLRNGLSVRKTVTVAKLGTASEESEESWLVVPAVREGDTVTETVEHLSSLKPGRITVATTLLSMTPRLRQAADARRCELLAVGSDSATKQELIAHALKTATGHEAMTVYDADSRPTSVGCYVREPHVCQQLSIYRSTVQPGTIRGELWRGMALNQTCWALGTEARMLRQGWMYYLVSHGLTLPVGLLREVGLRDCYPGEDVLFGYQLALLGLRPHIAPGLDIAGIPETRRQFLTQSARWFLGESTALAQMASLRRSVKVIARCLAVAWWPLGPPAIFAAAVVLLRSREPGRWCGILVLGGVVRYWLAASAQQGTSDVLQSGSRGSVSLWAFVGFLAKPCMSAAGAWWALARCGPRMTRGKAFPKARETKA